MDTIITGLKRYNASLDDLGFIVTPIGRHTTVRPTISKGRLLVKSSTGQLLFSGKPTADAIGDFVEKFWFWSRIN